MRAVGRLLGVELARHLEVLVRERDVLEHGHELALLQDPQAEALAAEARESVRAVYEGFAPTLAAVFQELAAPVLAAAGASAVEEVSVPAGGSGGGSGGLHDAIAAAEGRRGSRSACSS